ncbi:hypothetical protein E308F_17060 [Moorella sp. E308F]|uniref:hypothetical protein n=1 Tax=unclassified Neomoorella TaxID=2676739 RepID=UPI0010FFC0A9|nr:MULTISPECIES: hypothetical protein [unclassified Moorella (in: firmicutes)]GEA15462.1 hypothetical protein E308F_17060 [Moorella sp. E308F]GEA19680.1 hypothetical protein E306M_28180 [Moorella sp. E306M]
MKQKSTGRTLAETFLAILEEKYPEGVTTRSIAIRLFGNDSLENRIRVQRLARTLRKMGHSVWGYRGVYCLDPESGFLIAVGKDRAATTKGIAASNLAILKTFKESMPSWEERENYMKMQRELAEELIKIAKRLSNF